MAMRAAPRARDGERTRLLAAAALAMVAIVTLFLLFTALDLPPGERAGGDGVGSGGGSNNGDSPFDGHGDGTGNGGTKPGDTDPKRNELTNGHKDCTIAYIIAGVLGAAGAGLFAHALVKRVPRRELAYRGVASLLFVGLGVLMAVSCGYEPEAEKQPLPPLGTGGGGGGTGDGTGSTDRDGERPVEDPPEPPEIPWMVVALIAGLALVAAAGYFLLRTLRTKMPEGPDLTLAKKEAEAVLRGGGAGGADLSTDTHEAVVQAYTRFLAACALLGAPRHAHETPREHARLAPERTGFPPEAVEAIVEAYETVRYAERAPPPEAREKAIQGITRILEHDKLAPAGGATGGR